MCECWITLLIGWLFQILMRVQISSFVCGDGLRTKLATSFISICQGSESLSTQYHSHLNGMHAKVFRNILSRKAVDETLTGQKPICFRRLFIFITLEPWHTLWQKRCVSFLHITFSTCLHAPASSAVLFSPHGRQPAAGCRRLYEGSPLSRKYLRVYTQGKP